RALGSANIRGVMGPSICGKCYEVGDDVYREVVDKFPNAASITPKGTLSLDLAGALKELLSGYGVEVVRAQSCTVEDRSLFSYRRDGITGRFAGIISL
ncbi:MAG: laccase domain-containing protein, partial [Actinobacteria bacterium]|nr:laccase domain-containing protein [Actinomycetota bacterium]